jgi:hypothetical protein
MNKRHTEPLVVNKLDVIHTVEPVYKLKFSDFLCLTKIHSFIAIWAHSFFAGTGVFLVTLLAKFINCKFFDDPNSVTTLEWITLSILIFLAVIFELAYWKFPSERKKTIKKLELFFNQHG